MKIYIDVTRDVRTNLCNTTFTFSLIYFALQWKTATSYDNYLSYDAAVFQWITSCHKNRMTTRVITLLREYVTSLTTSVTTM